MNSIIIQDKSTVTMHFSIKLKDGSVADSTKVNTKPGVVTMGDGTLSENFEKQLYGLKPGDKKAFTLSPEDGFGLPNPANLHVLPRRQFSEYKLDIGLIMEFTLPSGGRIPGVIRQFDDNNVTIDLNNPLAGQELNIEVEILEVTLS